LLLVAPEGNVASTLRAVHTNETHLSVVSKQPDTRPGVRIAATTDHEQIRRWAARHGAQPATGQATASGPATVDINDGGAGIRFNFPGFAPLRAITWDEWFNNFERHDLLFVYEEADRDAIASRAYSVWLRRGAEHGSDRDDWFQAERDLRRAAGGGAPSVRYWIVKNRPL
jgi:hypothetical protein